MVGVVRQQAAEKVSPDCRDHVAVVEREGIAAVAALDQRLMQMPAARHHVGQRWAAHEAGETAVAPRDLLHRRTEQDHGVGGGEPDLRAERELALARPELDLDRAQRQAERLHAAADLLQHRIELIEPRLGEVLESLGDQADLRRGRRPGGVLRREARIDDAEQVEFDLEPGHEIEAGGAEPRQCVAVDPPRRERHRLAVGEIDVAQHPAGARRPWQHAKRRRVRDHDEITAALHFLEAEAAARREHRKRGLVGGVLGEQRRRHGDAALEGGRRRLRHQSLAAQDAVLVGERKPHQFELVLLDRLQSGLRGGGLLVVPQTMAIDEARRGRSARALRHQCPLAQLLVAWRS